MVRIRDGGMAYGGVLLIEAPVTPRPSPLNDYRS